MTHQITAHTFRFDKGQLQVIPMPNFNDFGSGILDHVTFAEAVAYARAHPVDVRREDVGKIKSLIWQKYGVNKFLFIEWQPTNLTEYKLEGVRMEIKYTNEEVFKNHKSIVYVERKQVACLIEDDKQ